MVAGAGLLGALCAVLIWPAFVDRIATSALRHADQAQTLARTFEHIPLNRDGAVQQAHALLIEGARRQREESKASIAASGAPWEDSVTPCIEYLRISATGDAEAYAAWSAAHGKFVPKRLPLWASYTIEDYAERYRRVVGRTMPAGISGPGYFKDYFEAYWSRGDGELRPESIVTDPRAIEVALQQLTHWGDYITARESNEGLGPYFWIGGIIIPGLLLWWPEHMADPAGDLAVESSHGGLPFVHDIQRSWWGAEIEQAGKVDAARVLLVYRSVRGIYVPCHFSLVHLPSAGGWQITSVSFGNIGREVRVGSKPLAAPPY